MTDWLTPWQYVLLVAASARVVHLLLWDSLFGFSTDSGTRLAQRLDRWAFTADGADRSWLRGKIGTLLTCHFCIGGWVTLAAVCAAAWVPPWDLGHIGWLCWLAVWAGQCVASHLDFRFL